MDSIQIKISEARKILQAIGLPLGEGNLKTELRQDRLALTLLAVADIKPSSKWAEAKIHGDGNNYALRTRDIIGFWNEFYGLQISSGSYDDVRRKNLIYLVEAGLVLPSVNDPDANTNNPTRRYAISQVGADILHWFRSRSSARRNSPLSKEKLDSLDRSSPLFQSNQPTEAFRFGTLN